MFYACTVEITGIRDGKEQKLKIYINESKKKRKEDRMKKKKPVACTENFALYRFKIRNEN